MNSKENKEKYTGQCGGRRGEGGVELYYNCNNVLKTSINKQTNTLGSSRLPEFPILCICNNTVEYKHKQIYTCACLHYHIKQQTPYTHHTINVFLYTDTMLSKDLLMILKSCSGNHQQQILKCAIVSWGFCWCAKPPRPEATWEIRVYFIIQFAVHHPGEVNIETWRQCC